MKARTLAVVAFGIALTLFLPVVTPNALAQADNDNFADAADLGNLASVADSGPMIGNGAELGEPAHGGFPAQQSIWIKWTAPSAGAVTIHSCHASVQFDSTIGVYEGPATGATFADLVTIGGANDGCGIANGPSRMGFTPVAGDTYYMALDKIGGGGTTFAIFIEQSLATNDAFSGPSIAGAPLTVTGTNEGATKEPNEPNHGGQPGGASVWWSWTAPATDTFRIDTCGSNFNTVLAVYIGDPFNGGITTPEVEDDNGCGIQQSAVSLSAVAGTVYRIAVDGGPDLGGPAEGNITLNIAPRPANDDLVNAESIFGFPVSGSANTVAATRQTDENDHGGVAGSGSVWYEWVATVNGPVTFDTCGSSIDTLLAVYAGPGGGFPLPAPLGENHDSCGTASAVNLSVTIGDTFLIAIDQPGFGGDVQLQIHDATGPNTTIDAFKVSHTKRRVKVTFSGTDDRPGAVTFECKRDGGAFQGCTSIAVFRFKPGKHTIQIRGVDVSGNEGAPESRTFRIKKTV